jgi:hypothetical protein
VIGDSRLVVAASMCRGAPKIAQTLNSTAAQRRGYKARRGSCSCAKRRWIRIVRKTMTKGFTEGANIRQQAATLCQRVEDNAFHLGTSRSVLCVCSPQFRVRALNDRDRLRPDE